MSRVPRGVFWVFASGVGIAALWGQATYGHSSAPHPDAAAVVFEEKLLGKAPVLPKLMVSTPIAGPDLDHLVFEGVIGQKGVVVFEGKILGEEYDETTFAAFRPDGKEVACVARKAGKKHLVVGARISEAYDDVSSAVFSPDGKKIAFVARVGDAYWRKVMVLSE